MKTISYLKKFRSTKAKTVLAMLGFAISASFGSACFAQNSQGWLDDLQPLDLGHAMVEKGNDNLIAGRKLIREGQEQISVANDAVREGRSKYRKLLGSGSVNPDNATALATADSEILSNLDEIADGNSMVMRGEQLVVKGREQINNGRLTINSGYKKTQKTKPAVALRLMLPEKSALEE